MLGDVDGFRKWPTNGLVGKALAPDGTEIDKIRAFIIPIGEVPMLGLFRAQGRQSELIELHIATDLVWNGDGKRTPHEVSTDEGTWLIYAQGCACGSPLKRLGHNEARSAMERAQVPA